jgi:FkbM family methyltransferase
MDPNDFVFLDRVLRPDMVFVDVGANEGLYTLFAAKRVQQVIAVEPSKREFQRLQDNVQLNSLKNVTGCQTALSNQDGQAMLKVATDHYGVHNTLGDFPNASMQLSHMEPVTLKRLDTLIAELQPDRVDLLKIDAEGAEVVVLQGATGVLASFHPTILVELNENTLEKQGHHTRDVLDFLRGFGYEIFSFDSETAALYPARGDETSFNVVAAHPSSGPGINGEAQ